MIAALVKKDVKLYFRNRFIAVVTIMGLVFYAILYYMLPAQVDETLDIALFIENPQATQIDERFEEYFEFTSFDSEAAMLAALEEEGDYLAGIAISASEAAAIDRGEKASIRAFYAPGIPTEVKNAYDDLLTITANGASPAFGGQFGRIDEEAVVLGPDMLESPIPIRDRFVPMMLLFLLAVEVMGVASLIMQEAESGTAQAVLTSPLRLSQFFTGKVIMGLAVAFVQLILLAAVIGKMSTSPLELMVTLLLGSFMIVGLSFLIASISRDYMSVLAWGMLVIIVFSIPAIAVLLPGLATAWAELIPSYFLVDAIHRILNFNASWGEIGSHLVVLFAAGLATMALGSALLRRRFQ